MSILRAAAEPTRLRLLSLLIRAELTVGEICRILGQSQPRISRHLKVLNEAGLLDRFREQHWVYYRTPPAGEGLDTVHQLLALVDSKDATFAVDRQRLDAVMVARAQKIPPGQILADSFSAEVDATVLSELGSEPMGALLDVGTGTGHWLELLAARASRAVGIDISSDALRLARTNVHGAGLSHCELQHGDMYRLPFPAPVFDTAVADRVLASADNPVAALAEITRTLKYQGRLLVIESFDALSEIVPTNPIATLNAWFAQVGLKCDRMRPLDIPGGHLLVAIARRSVSVTAAA